METLLRPRVRGDCVDGPRPCPWVTCRWNLLVYVKGGKGRKPPKVIELDAAESCALDVADAGGQTLDGVSKFLGVTRERVRQVEEKALRKLVSRMNAAGIRREVLSGFAHAAGNHVQVQRKGSDADGGYLAVADFADVKLPSGGRFDPYASENSQPRGSRGKNERAAAARRAGYAESERRERMTGAQTKTKVLDDHRARPGPLGDAVRAFSAGKASAKPVLDALADLVDQSAVPSEAAVYAWRKRRFGDVPRLTGGGRPKGKRTRDPLGLGAGLRRPTSSPVKEVKEVAVEQPRSEAVALVQDAEYEVAVDYATPGSDRTVRSKFRVEPDGSVYCEHVEDAVELSRLIRARLERAAG